MTTSWYFSNVNMIVMKAINAAGAPSPYAETEQFVGKVGQGPGDVWRNRVSHYSVSAVGENFAEMYTQKYTNGGVPPKIGAYDPAVFFDNLTAAGPAELGLAPYTDNAKSPGAGEGADLEGETGDKNKPGGGSGPPPPPRPWP